MTIRHSSLATFAICLSVSLDAAAQDDFVCHIPENAPESSAWDYAAWLYRVLDPSETNPTGMVGVPPASAASASATPLGPDERRIVLFGDLMTSEHDELPRVDASLRSLMASAHLVIGNMEGPVVTGPLDVNSSQFFDFHATTGYVRSFFAQYCVNPDNMVFTIANNHAADHGRWPQTLQSLVAANDVPAPGDGAADAPLVVRGVVGGPSTSNQDVDVYDLDGVRVGVVGWTHTENCEPDEAWVESDIVWRRPADVGIHFSATSEPSVSVDWEAVKGERSIDVLIGAVHWDRQFYYFPELKTQKLGRALIDSGFDVIAGADPHVLQPAQLLPSGAVFHSLAGINVNFGWLSKTTLIPVVEIIVDGQGRMTRYEVHAYAQRAVSGDVWLDDVSCDFTSAGGATQTMGDVRRKTGSEIVPLSHVSNFWGVRSRLERELNLVFPSP